MIDGLPRHGASLLTAVLDWAEPWWDEQASLLWNMEGSFTELCSPQSVHVIPPSAWFALGLLVRDGPDDRARAEATLWALLDQQYDEPGTDWHGTFARFAEWPHPEPDAVAFDGYDPNWRQFLGTAFALVLDEAEDRLDPSLASALERSILLAVEGEPEGRVRPSYSNIALMKSWLDVWAGVRANDVEGAARGELLAGRLVGRFAKTGAFDEYQSPTYYGIDLYALALWRERSRSALMQEAGVHLEAALWRDVADLYHAGLRNLCGPWDRSYGLDMGGYLGAMGLWWWPALGREAAPIPDFETSFEHSHDTLLGVPAAVLGPAIPADAVEPLTRFPGHHVVGRDLGRRIVTAWLDDRAMLGGMKGSSAHARGQHHPAVGHWLLPDDGIAHLRIRHAGPVDAIVTEARMAVSIEEPASDTVLEITVGDTTAAELRSSLVTGREIRESLALPGLDLDLRSSDAATSVDVSDGVAKIRWEASPYRFDLVLNIV